MGYDELTNTLSIVSADSQHSFFDFNQPLGLRMNPEKRWIKMADNIPRDVFEEKYAGKFRSRIGNVAKPLSMALGALIIQKKYNYSDRELIEQLTENPYYQYLCNYHCLLNEKNYYIGNKCFKM